MRVIVNPDNIIQELLNLKVGELAYLKVVKKEGYQDSPEWYTKHKVRLIQTFEDGTSHFKVREYRDQTGMIGPEHKMYESCFSSNANSLSRNVDNMLDHDAGVWINSMLIICSEALEDKVTSLALLQNGMYNESWLTLRGCTIAPKLQLAFEDYHASNLQGIA